MKLFHMRHAFSAVVLLCVGTILGCGGDTNSSNKAKPSGSDSAATSSDTTDETDDAGDQTAAADTQVITEGWGHLTGRFTLAGAPEPEKIAVKGDAANFCGKFELVDESYVVNPENNGLANVIVWLYLKSSDTPPEVHESYNEAATNPELLDNVDCRFEPRVVTLVTNQSLDIKNSDSVGHNTNIAYEPAPMNRIVPVNATINYDKFESENRLPSRVACNIHPWMTAWLLVKQTPYMAVTDKDGKFTIENLPAGEWTFQVWHEANGYIMKANTGQGAQNWKRGRFTQTINGGDNTTDLGEIKLNFDELTQ